MSDPGFLFGPGPAGNWDDARASCPIVRRADDGFRMWYYGREKTFPGVTAENERSVLPMGRSGLAISRDGIAWQKVPGPGARGSVLDPAAEAGRFDSFQVGATDVLPVDGEYWMYYQGGRETSGLVDGQPRKGFPLNIGLAVSSDGLHFRRIAGSLPGGAILGNGADQDWDAWYAGFPRVNALPTGGYWLTYSGSGPQGPGVGAAISGDGVVWEKLGRIFGTSPNPESFDCRSVGSRSIVPFGGRFIMVYEAIDAENRFRIGLAESDDLLHWSRIAGRGPKRSLIEYGAPGSFDELAIGTPYLVAEPDGSLKLYHVGFSMAGASGIGLLLCDGRDLTRWQRAG
ncbi:MAG: hypothetical protein U0556_12115 [Dehalococcoidia bacterium]